MTFTANNSVIIDLTSREAFFANVSIFGSNSSYLFVEDAFQGTVSGYSSGGYAGPPGSRVQTIDKFPFATDANATNVGSLAGGPFDGKWWLAGQSSAVSGYATGGWGINEFFDNNRIEKFPFATNTDATYIANLTTRRGGAVGQSSLISGYTSGGQVPVYPYYFGPPYSVNVIDKFPFATDTNATDVGDLTAARWRAAGQSSSVSGYTSDSIIDKFPFATNANATNVGNLTVSRSDIAGQSSLVSGYASGNSTTIDKFPFATDANATNVGNLTVGRSFFGLAGQSSTISGYATGGWATNVIDKFPFATDANATDVGDLTQARYGAVGQQD